MKVTNLDAMLCTTPLLGTHLRSCSGSGLQASRIGMNILEFTLVVALMALDAGYLGSLTGLGGGVVVTPVLVLLCYKVNILLVLQGALHYCEVV